MTHLKPLPKNPEDKHNPISEEVILRQARTLSRKWQDRLDEFELPCPLCKGDLIFHGVNADRLYEFAEGEPGTVEALNIYPIIFVCNKCGYNVEFDSELFNPAYLAKLAGAEEHKVVELTVRDFRVLVPLRGEERSNTLLDLATTIAGERHGDAVVLDLAKTDSLEAMLVEKVQNYTPGIGDPSPVHIVRKGQKELQEVIPEILEEQRCNLLLFNAKGWSRTEEAAIASIIDETLHSAVCDVGLVFDRGFRDVHRIMLATSGGPSAKAAAPFAHDLARALDAELHLLYVASPDAANGEDEGQRHIAATMENIPYDENLKLQKRVIFNKKPIDAIIAESANYDLLVMGGSPKGWHNRLRLDTVSTKIARNSTATAMVMLAREGRIRSWLSRLLG